MRPRKTPPQKKRGSVLFPKTSGAGTRGGGDAASEAPVLEVPPPKELRKQLEIAGAGETGGGERRVSRARLIPQTDLEGIRPCSEQAVARRLIEQLDDSWLVLHSYPWLRSVGKKKGRHLIEGEVDFILLHREHGALFIEVKGSEVCYDGAARRWVQRDGRHPARPIKDPFEQVARNKHNVITEVCRRLGISKQEMPCRYGHAVIFPDCDYRGPLPPNAEPAVLFGYRDLPHLAERLPKAFAMGPPSAARIMSDVELQRVKDALLPAFCIIPVLAARVARDEEVLVRLTAQQQAVLRGMRRNRRMLVEGTAGSGKTVLAVWKAQEFVKAQMRTLLVCFNRGLAESLRARLSHPYLTISTFHGLCREVCQRAGVPFQPPAHGSVAMRRRWWQEQAPELFANALERVDERFDAIVVDEAQDFFPRWWTPLELAMRDEDETPLYIFYDRNQNLFGADLTFPKVQASYALPVNCRNTRCIAETTGQVIGEEIEVWPGTPRGRAPTVQVFPAGTALRSECERHLLRLTGPGRLAHRQIAILSPHRPEHTSVPPGALAGLRLTADLDAWRTDEAILFTTIRSFKGLEATAVILLLEVTGFLPHIFEPTDLYVACSRAKHELVVLTTSQEVAGRVRASSAPR